LQQRLQPKPKGENTMKEQRFDIHQQITDQIIAAIEQGAGEYRCPWHRSAGNIMRPVNVASKKAYNGVNILALWASADAKGYQSGLWGTFKQWTDAGAQVRKGEKAAHVVFYKEITVAADRDEAEGEEAETRLFARATPVFAAEQVDGYAAPALPELPAHSITPIARAEAFVAATGASIVHGGSRACYIPSTDNIHMPCIDVFHDAEGYAATKLHELTHWTSAEARCNRQLGKRFGDHAYAMEELVAELGAAFLCADLAISDAPRDDHAQYLESWLAVLKADKKAIFAAASKASQAVGFLHGMQPRHEPAEAA
jgi:antirestriction protein ArdC